LDPENLAQARSFFDRALTADPDNVDALIGSARVDELEGGLFFAPDPMAAFVAAEAKLTKALSSVPDHARICIWDLLRFSPSALPRASPVVNMRWSWIAAAAAPRLSAQW
jgi:hypothetical protein